MQKAPASRIAELTNLAAKRKNEILNTKSDYPKGRKTYYFDDIGGNDDNDGLSPETAFKTIDKTGNYDFEEGSVVLFKRGGLWRGVLTLCDGVTYSAYGEGEKPKFYGSIDASDPDNWIKTKYENVWMFRPEINYVRDVGCIIINGGKLWGIKVCLNLKEGVRCDGTDDVFNGRSYVHRERVPFKGPQDLKGDLEFLHYYNNERLYIYCADGNPGKVFDSIELNIRRNITRGGGRNCLIDNLCFMYAGIHAMGHGGRDIRVQNCEFGWIGGSNQFPEHQLLGLKCPFGDDTTRLGNGCEVYGGAENYYVNNCYFHQIYDAAITAQYMNANVGDKDFIMQNIEWSNNVIDTSNYCFELWLAIQNKNENTRVEMNNVHIHDNICTNAGLGWGNQRPDKGSAFFYGDPQHTVCKFNDVVFYDNIFLNSYGRISCARMMGKDNGMYFKHNEIYSNTKVLGVHCADLKDRTTELKPIPATDENLKMLIDGGYWEDCSFYTFDKDENVSEPYIKY